MSLEAEFELDSDELVLGRLLAEYPALTFELERLVPVGERVMPYVWVYGAGIDAFAADLADQGAADLIEQARREEPDEAKRDG